MKRLQSVWLTATAGAVACLAVLYAFEPLGSRSSKSPASGQEGAAPVESLADALAESTDTSSAIQTEPQDELAAILAVEKAIDRNGIDGVIIGVESAEERKEDEKTTHVVKFVLRCHETSVIARYELNVDNMEVKSTGLKCE